MKIKTIKSFKIENIKGIKNKTFELNIIPNKPTILVAPNGFGKSSLAIAFQSLNSSRIDLDEENYNENKPENTPSIMIDVVSDDIIDNEFSLEANHESNDINEIFDTYVINSGLKTKTINRNFGGFSSAKSYITVEEIVLIKNIPEKKEYKYSIEKLKSDFGENGKILPNIKSIISNKHIIIDLKENVFTAGLPKKIDELFSEINKLKGTTDEIKKQLEDNIINNFKKIKSFNSILETINKYESKTFTEIEQCIIAIEILFIYKHYEAEFKSVYKYYEYLIEKEEIIQLFGFLKNTWQEIKPKEDKKNGLIIKFPNVKHISNGERDIINFVASLYKAKTKLRKDNCILIIDEIFDYLDDANLVAAQYYITKLIKYFKNCNKNIFPIILTHINPNYFKNFCFNKPQIVYLNKKDNKNSEWTMKLISSREHPDIQNLVDIYHFHYNPGNINIRDKFKNLKLKETWGDSVLFKKYNNQELKKYLEGIDDYDPLAVCFSIRVIIEEKIYNELKTEEQKNVFLATHKTAKRLEYAEEDCGIDIPEIFYMLGIIYNEAAHTYKDDYVTPILSKLENLTIKEMIKIVAGF